jgi:PAS domain S-box-containing protein
VASLEDALTQGGFDSSAFAAALAATTQSLVCVLDAEGHILVFNEACERATGFSRDEVLGRDARDFVIPPEEREAFDAWIAEIWRTRAPSPQVGHWVTRDGGRILVAWSNGPVLGEGGDLQYLMTTGLDITDRERTEAEKRALEGDLEAKLVQISHLAQEQRGLRRVATLVAAEAPPERVFTAVSEECARVLDGTACAIMRFEPDATAVVVGRYSRAPVAAFLVGDVISLDENSAVGRVYLRGEPARIDGYENLPGAVAETMTRHGYRYSVAAPIVVAGSLWGAVAVSSSTAEDLPAQSEARLGDFCELISLAVASAQAREDLRASRARIVQTADDERRRLERNLHDGAQQRLVSLSIAIRLAQRRLASDPEGTAKLLDAAALDVDEAVAELRELARGLHPVALTELGLRPALQGLAERAPIRVEISGVPEERLPAPVEAAAYYIVAETLTNCVKHAEAETCRVVIAREDEHVTVEVSDDGRGGADPAGGSGLVGLRDRVDALGGSLTVHSPPGEGTVVRAVLPLAPAGS